ncbi:hypothetical protein HG263_16750 [Pseudoalteromonas sp. JBTF-M23]|uniref:Uncharacterized protein n=1 Tax=Pseudoalteromonas caenipelagi TaxID=2726988 RepID=A0A849VH92_9GAMM|nr:hypothetical protein [Pseudoalteromonas caenipelagi]NOU52180.1 hypothetical protein [Pseudoalteromonas caenipelagi]
MDTSLDYSTSMNVYVQSLQDKQLIENVYKNNDLPAPTYLDDIIVQPIVSKNISPAGLGAINNLIIINKYLNSDLNNLARYIINLQTQKEVLESEVEYQSDLIDIEQLERRVELLKQRLGEQLKGQQGAVEAAP